MSPFTSLRAGLTFAALVGVATSAVATPAHFIPSRVVESPDGKVGYTLTERTALGGPDAADEAQFYEKLGSVAIDADADGNLYVLDNGNCRVQVFDASDRFVRTIGGEGGGPGEFKLPRILDVNPAGQVAVHDLGQSRVSVFDADGTLLGDFVPPSPVGGVVLLEDGTLAIGYEEDRPAPVQRVDASGEVLWSYGDAKPMPRQDMVFKVASRTFAPSMAMFDGRILRASDGAYCVLALSPEGTELDRFARAYDRKKMELPRRGGGDDDEEGGHQMMMITVTESDDGSGPERDVSVGDGEQTSTLDMGDLQSMMPEFSADVRGLLAWPDGRLWVLTSDADDDRIVADEWKGKAFAGSFEIPAYDRYAVGADGALYAVSHDDDDFPFVHRLDVTAR